MTSLFFPFLCNLFILVVLGLPCCVGAFFSCGEWGLLSNCGGLATCCGGFSCCGAM